MTRILFVCLGNICRSPAAEGLMRQLAHRQPEHRQLTQGQTCVSNNTLQIDSAGTGNWHMGRPPDRRMIAAAGRRNIDISPLRARQICPGDFYGVDHILAMDASNLADLRELAPDDSTATLSLFMKYSEQDWPMDVPDPYYGGADGFEVVLDMLAAASAGFLDRLAGRGTSGS